MKGDRLGELEELTLLAVLALGDEAYGTAVQEVIEREARREVSLGAVYAALERMERKAYVRSGLTGTPVGPGGKRRRVFDITPAGLRVVSDVRRGRDALWKAAPRAARERS